MKPISSWLWLARCPRWARNIILFPVALASLRHAGPFIRERSRRAVRLFWKKQRVIGPIEHSRKGWRNN